MKNRQRNIHLRPQAAGQNVLARHQATFHPKWPVHLLHSSTCEVVRYIVYIHLKYAVFSEDNFILIINLGGLITHPSKKFGLFLLSTLGPFTKCDPQ